MAEALAKKKRIRAGHRASATRTTRQVEDILSSEVPDKERLALLGLTLNEKLETIKTLDSEVIDFIEDEETLAAEIEQADDYKESIFSALIKSTELSRPRPRDVLRRPLEHRLATPDLRPTMLVRAACAFRSSNCAPSVET